MRLIKLFFLRLSLDWARRQRAEYKADLAACERNIARLEREQRKLRSPKPKAAKVIPFPAAPQLSFKQFAIVRKEVA